MKEKVWMADVSAWRKDYCGHKDYRADHPQETEYLKMRTKFDQKMATLQRKYVEHLTMLKKAEQL